MKSNHETADRVRALAAECADMLAWLRGKGTSAAAEEFSARLRAYLALHEAISLLPRGPQQLRSAGADLPEKPVYDVVERRADSFSPDEVALWADGEAILTPDGWVVSGPLATRVDAVRRRLEMDGKRSTDQDALIDMLKSSAAAQGVGEWRELQKLGKMKVRLSRERKAAAITRGTFDKED